MILELSVLFAVQIGIGYLFYESENDITIRREEHYGDDILFYDIQ